MQDLEIVETETDDVTPNPWAHTSDRALAEFTADQLVALVAIMGDIRDKVEPAVAKLGPALAMFGLGG